MRFPSLDEQRTGVLIAVSSLRSASSRGVGELTDLKRLAPWCQEHGIPLLQILPVNDTGIQPSPYSALSAFALHPVYASIELLPEYPRSGVAELESLETTSDSTQPIRFEVVARTKEAILKRIYQAGRGEIAADSAFQEWIAANPWVRTYAVFRALRTHHAGKAWMEWPEDQRHGSPELVERYWQEGLDVEPQYYAWIQYRLEEQFVETSRFLESRGVYLKGDLPILMNEDSADVWANRRIFTRDLRAGAPPDMFSDLGQNWDFPIYDWDYLEETEFRWWKDRLVQADKYYHAYRIDHVLGFFRIWAIPAASYSGTLGHFVPYEYLTTESLRKHGFDDGRITWLAEPHVSEESVRSRFGDESQAVTEQALRRIGDEPLFRFRDEIQGERDVLALEISRQSIDGLLELYRDRALIGVDVGTFFPAWTFRRCSRFEGLEPHERSTFESLASAAADASEELWERQGRRLLTLMSGTAEMLTCAEDLGVVPRSVPEVLAELGILGLRIPRWTRHYREPDEPFFRPQEYPPLTICATSVHDTSTFRGWWTEDADRQAFWQALGFDGDAPVDFDPDTATTVYTALAKVESTILLFQMQDVFDLDAGIRSPSPERDRVNVPGTVAERNWSYRWPITIEELSGRSEMNRRIDAIVAARS